MKLGHVTDPEMPQLRVASGFSRNSTSTQRTRAVKDGVFAPGGHFVKFNVVKHTNYVIKTQQTRLKMEKEAINLHYT